MTTMLALTWGPMEIGIVLLVVLVLFGANRLPKLARSLGQSMTEFKKGLRGDSSTKDDPKKVEPPDDEEKKPEA